MTKIRHYTIALILILIAAFFSPKVMAALYNIVNTDIFVNGVPPSLTTKERAKLVTTTVTKTQTSCLAGKCKLVDTAAAKAKIKQIIIDETPPATCPSGQTGTPPNCVTPPPPPPTGDINDGSTGMPKVNLALVPPAAVGYSALRLIPQNHVPVPNTGANSNNGEFRIGCAYSHMSNNDPIVYPNQKGASHLHTFFGNTGVDEKSTNASLASSGNSTCDGGIMNRSGYWIPSMIDTRDGRPIAPTGANFYYKTGNKNAVKVPPKGLRMIVGSASASSGQPESTYWCAPNGGDDTKHIHSCGIGESLIMTIRFPACWDGKNLDSPNHKDHMSFYGSGGCPSTHPVQLPDITLNVRYPAVQATDDMSKWRLASDKYSTSIAGGYSIHADWMNGWSDDPVTGVNFAEIFTKNCLQAGMNCGNALLGDGRQYYY
jgi:hypothetical protein